MSSSSRGRKQPTVPQPAMSEKAFQAAVVELATLLRWRTYHTYDSRRSDAGFPDLVLTRNDGRLLFIELKTQRGRIRPEQRDWLAALQQTAAEVYLWRPSDLDEIVRILQ